MSTCSRWSLSLCLVSLVAIIAKGDEKPAVAEEKPSTAARVGNELLFMVADFAPGGPFKGHCGCPSAMIGNHDAKAIVIWSKTPDDATLKLAAGANDQLGEGHRTQGYLILFDVNDTDFEKIAKKAAFQRLTLGSARLDAERVFKQAEIDNDAVQVVMLVDDKKITAVWQLKPSELTPEMSRAILKEAAAIGP